MRIINVSQNVKYKTVITVRMIKNAINAKVGIF